MSKQDHTVKSEKAEELGVLDTNAMNAAIASTTYGGMVPTTDPSAQMMPMMQMMDPAAYGAMNMQYANMMGAQAMMDPATVAQMMRVAAGQANGTLNSIGLPIRENMATCTHFANFGECKFEATYGTPCNFNHPEAYIGTGAPAILGEPKMYIGSGPGAANVNSLGYPVRPGQMACTFFSKTGVCRYGATCKWDHPEEFTYLAAVHGSKIQLQEFPITGYNSAGYPVRTGSAPCSFFMRTGTCKFGNACKWDHPETGLSAALAGAATAAMYDPTGLAQMGYGAIPTQTEPPRPSPY